VPHETYRDEQQWEETPVLLGCDAQPQHAFDVLLNLGSEVPVAAALARRVSEIIDADEVRRRAGRVRFRHYRDAGLTPQTHNIPAGQST
jgi:DNA polymerase-3 subunit chi